MLKYVFLIAFLLVSFMAIGATAPDGVKPDVSTGAVTFYDTLPGDDWSKGAGSVQVLADASGLSFTFWDYRIQILGGGARDTSWVKIKPVYFTVSATVTDSMLTLGANETAFFTFLSGARPDLMYVITAGTPDIWWE